MRRFRWLLAVPLALLAAWLLFLDSHSVVRRVRWTHELAALQAGNARLDAGIVSLEEQVQHADEPDVVERVAREQYGMRRPGETVYRAETAPADD